ncbi:pseudouridine-5'-phosphate glycosidase [Ferrimonas marina]|uniref:Pseudouridine-5'-phosphate glycosidase n=1 Tax=Ferrimonas marina TaxID=299255 RepID=A0A1M5XEF9_9GAMM|nr:pseudouridine-5'-phosphate glycosidase [Ferrimonas marina]SHH98139.1 pseudouridine-5'-phosphate glycosidase [Ferrimonas marina]
MRALKLHPEVASALSHGQPVVALESTLIAHGMPHPDNLDTARQLEQRVRDEGAVPATIAILDGQPTIGLTDAQLQCLADSPTPVAKVSRRDLPFVVQSGRMGATTVAATMWLAAKAGIRLFATGGIGGVHRQAQHSFDVSADLQELAQTDVAVVCAGAKSILDLALTREVLETLGVPVVGYQTDTLPAFYCRDSDEGVDYRLDSVSAIGEALRWKWQSGLHGGVVIANPIPEAHALPRAQMDEAIETALAQAQSQGIRGKAITPFLLAKIRELTRGASQQANVALVLNNATLAAQIAVAMSTSDS